MLTPMSKYFASEMCMRVAMNGISVMGGNGYMHDYPLERHLRDSRITTIYEGHDAAADRAVGQRCQFRHHRRAAG
jgi:alkylation response protein AidB-like acyl-CoA dehydrogenase